MIPSLEQEGIDWQQHVNSGDEGFFCAGRGAIYVEDSLR